VDAAATGEGPRPVVAVAAAAVGEGPRPVVEAAAGNGTTSSSRTAPAECGAAVLAVAVAAAEQRRPPAPPRRLPYQDQSLLFLPSRETPLLCRGTWGGWPWRTLLRARTRSCRRPRRRRARRSSPWRARGSARWGGRSTSTRTISASSSPIKSSATTT
jgi:hypothetical protein